MRVQEVVSVSTSRSPDAQRLVSVSSWQKNENVLVSSRLFTSRAQVNIMYYVLLLLLLLLMDVKISLRLQSL